MKLNNIVMLHLKINKMVPLTSESLKKRHMFHSLSGKDLLWYLPTNISSHSCEYHITFNSNFDKKWPFIGNRHLYNLKFHVNDLNTVILELLSSSIVNDFRFLIVISISHNKYKVVFENFQSKENITLFETTNLNIYDLCTITEHILIINTVELSLLRLVGSRWHKVISIKNPLFNQLRWFSIGSDGNFSVWNLFCPITKFVFGNETFPTAKGKFF